MTKKTQRRRGVIAQYVQGVAGQLSWVLELAVSPRRSFCRRRRHSEPFEDPADCWGITAVADLEPFAVNPLKAAAPSFAVQSV